MRTDRYKGRNSGKHSRIEPKNSMRIRRIILVVFILLLIAGITAEVITLLSITNIDRRFTRSVERGLYDGWSLNGGETQLQSAGRITDTGFLDAEYNAISEYAKKKYKDDDIGHLANEYISALKDCRLVAHQHDPAADFDVFWSYFSEPYARRVRALYGLYQGDFNLMLENEDFADEASLLIAQGWLLESVDDLVFSKINVGDHQVFSARLSNDSGRGIEYLNLDIVLLDNKDNIVETSSVYITDIHDGDMMDLRFISTSDKAVKYRIVSETCKFMEALEETDQENIQV